jgi:hypothetical protein
MKKSFIIRIFNLKVGCLHPVACTRYTQQDFRLKMVIRPKHVAVTEQNTENSVVLDGNPEPDLEFLT